MIFYMKKSKSNISISFNRISFIFFIFFIIFIIYSIHLAHLGSRKSKIENDYFNQSIDTLYRADIVDRNGRYLVKTIGSIDVGIVVKKL